MHVSVNDRIKVGSRKRRLEFYGDLFGTLLTRGCLVNQCRKTFKTRMVEAVLTMVYSFAFCSLALEESVFMLAPVSCGDAQLPPKILQLDHQ